MASANKPTKWDAHYMEHVPNESSGRYENRVLTLWAVTGDEARVSALRSMRGEPRCVLGVICPHGQ